MEIEDGVVWVYGVGEDDVQAFTDFGIEKLIELIRFYKEDLDCSDSSPAAYAERIPTGSPPPNRSAINAREHLTQDEGGFLLLNQIISPFGRWETWPCSP